MKPKLVIVNVFFAPQSFGGATIVAEELAKNLKQNFNITVITSINDDQKALYSLVRYRAKGINIVCINLPNHIDHIESYRNFTFANKFKFLFDLIKPDIVHSHCVQKLGAAYFNDIKDAKIPHVISIHDNWWICEKQFMVNNLGVFCNQKEINLSVCKICTYDINRNFIGHYSLEYRKKYLRQQLSLTDKILFPSSYQKNLYQINLPALRDKFILNKNGIKFPKKGYVKSHSEKTTRFGFVGGIGPNKGSVQILNAFKKINNSNYELIIVDNTLNLGYSSVNIDLAEYKGKVTIVPAYTQDNIDDLFNKFDVLLFPSQVKESFGLTIREALVRDIWVISSDNGGGTEEITENENGNIIPMDNDFTILKASIENIMEKDLSNYTNIHKNLITSFETQAQEITKIFLNLIKKNKCIKPIANLFLGVGAMKAGTSWITKNLETHKDIFFTFEKELSYFSYLNNESCKFFLTQENRLKKVKYFKKIAKLTSEKNQKQLKDWSLNYISNPIDDNWYKNNFIHQSSEKYSSDFSNLYSKLDSKGWDHVKSLTDNLKVVYIMRDPIKRLWSHVKYQLEIDGKIEEAKKWSKEQIFEYANVEHMLVNSNYTKILSGLINNLDLNQLHICFFEDIVESPEKLLNGIEDFLEVERRIYDLKELKKKINPSKSFPMPNYFENLFKVKLHGYVKGLHCLGVKVPQEWSIR